MRNLHPVFHSGCTNLYSPTVQKGSLFSPSLPTLVTWGLFDHSHSDRYEVIYHCGFDLHFPGDYWCWASFHVPVGQLNAFFGKMSFQILCLFFNWIVCGGFSFFFLNRGRILNLKKLFSSSLDDHIFSFINVEHSIDFLV